MTGFALLPNRLAGYSRQLLRSSLDVRQRRFTTGPRESRGYGIGHSGSVVGCPGSIMRRDMTLRTRRHQRYSVLPACVLRRLPSPGAGETVGRSGHSGCVRLRVMAPVVPVAEARSAAGHDPETFTARFWGRRGLSCWCPVSVMRYAAYCPRPRRRGLRPMGHRPHCAGPVGHRPHCAGPVGHRPHRAGPGGHGPHTAAAPPGIRNGHGTVKGAIRP
jgi:hypothetical protein